MACGASVPLPMRVAIWNYVSLTRPEGAGCIASGYSVRPSVRPIPTRGRHFFYSPNAKAETPALGPIFRDHRGSDVAWAGQAPAFVSAFPVCSSWGFRAAAAGCPICKRCPWRCWRYACRCFLPPTAASTRHGQLRMPHSAGGAARRRRHWRIRAPANPGGRCRWPPTGR